MKPLDHKYLIQRKAGIVSVQSIDPLTGHVTFLGPPRPEMAAKFFDMGFIGSRCQQLAFSILCDFTGDQIVAYRLEIMFEHHFVLRWTGASAEIDGATIMGFLAECAEQGLIDRPRVTVSVNRQIHREEAKDAKVES